MIESCPSRIEYSAIFEAEKVKFFILKTKREEYSRIYFQVIKNQNYWEEKYEPKLTYWGPFKDLNNIDLINNLRNISQDSTINAKFTPKILKTMVNTYGLSIYKKSILSKIEKSLEDSFNTAKLTNFVDGLTTDKSNKTLTLSSAQDIDKKVRESDHLDNTDLTLIKILLTEAPLVFGYWGPFKTLMKYLDPSLMPIEFGKAIGRLVKSRGFTPSDIFIDKSIKTSTNFEDIGWLKYFIPIPSVDTYNYMSRRMRRFISKLAIEQPKIYPIISSSILIEWDSRIFSDSFIPSYVLGGNERTLDSISRNVQIPFVQSHRRDSHPELWDKNLDLIKSILSQIKKSPEIFTFCIHILNANNQSIPNLSERLIRLALQSYDQNIINLVIPYIIKNQTIWDIIPSNLWFQFLKDKSNLENIDKLLIEIGSKEIYLPLLHNSLIDLIKEHLDNDFNNTSEYISKISQLFLYSYSNIDSWNKRFESDDILINSIELTFNYLPFDFSIEKWKSIFDDIRLSIIIQSYINLLKNSSIKEECTQIISKYIFDSNIDDNDLLIEVLKICFENIEPILYKMGWHFISLGENNELYYFDDLWEWLKTKHTSNLLREKWSIHRLELIVALLKRRTDNKIYELLTDNSWNFDKSEISWLLTNLSELRLFTWDQIDQEGFNSLKDILLADSSLIISIGDSLSADEIKTSGPSQQDFLQRYIVLNTNRVKTDRTFAIAMVALPNPSLQETVLHQLSVANEIKNCWLTLAEVGLPLPLETVRNFLISEPDDEKFNQNIVACIDSMVNQLRDMGFELLDEQRHRVDQEYIASVLVDSDDSKVKTKVAEEALSREWKENPSLASFDKRILITRRSNRKAKELVKERLEVRNQSGESDYLAPERREALLDLAKGANLRDKEWALQKIAELALQGVPFDCIQVSVTTPRTN